MNMAKSYRRWVFAAGALFGALACVAATVRPVATQEALVNPGMGWVYYHYDDSNWNYGSETAPGDSLDWFPGCSTVYFRLPWCDLEPEEGVYRWDVIDSVAQPWIAAGKCVAFRFTCSESSYVRAVPEWVSAAGAKGDWLVMRKKKSDEGFRLWEPDWLDPVFLAKYENFIKAAAARWDGNPSVAFIDVGSFGMWGEGHTYSTSQLPAEKTREIGLVHAKLLRRHFTQTPVLMSDDIAGGWNRAADDPAMAELRRLGIGFRDDSIMCSKHPNHWFHGGWARKFVAAGLPVVVEAGHDYADKNNETKFDGGFLQSTVEYQASYQAIHWWPREFLSRHRAEIDQVNRRLGYRFELREATWPDEVRVGERFDLRAAWVNVGVAPPREGCFACWTLLDAKGTVVWTSVDETFDFRDLPPTLEDGERTVVRTGAVRFGWDWPTCGVYHGSGNPEKRHDGSTHPRGACVGTLAPGTYALCVSVGRRDGTPRIALPLNDEIGTSHRYRLGAISIRR